MKCSPFVHFGFCSLVITGMLACSPAEKKPAERTDTTKVKVSNPNPFPFYKSIEIKPGYYFEVLSWGKGVDSVGGFLILMSDSVKQNYRSVSVERKGQLVDAWNMDLDNDGNPEIYVQYVVRKNVNDLNVYEFAANSFNKISFPGLSSQLKETFLGNDKFFVKSGGLFRSLPLQQTKDGKTAAQVKQLEYRLSGNSFSSKETE